MSNFYIFGDTHGTMEISKIFGVKDYEKDDFIIVCGDFGVLWSDTPSEKEKEIIKAIKKLPCTLLFIDGNHENFNRLDALKSVEKFGGRVGEYIKNKAYHLKRGEIYSILGRNILTLGGALSIDKAWREENVSWWAGEAITHEQLAHALENIAKFSQNINIIITHTCPSSFLSYMSKFMFISHKFHDPNPEKLDRVLKALVKKQPNVPMKWFFGHWHEDFGFAYEKANLKAYCMYIDVFRLGEDEARLYPTWGVYKNEVRGEF